MEHYYINTMNTVEPDGYNLNRGSVKPPRYLRKTEPPKPRKKKTFVWNDEERRLWAEARRRVGTKIQDRVKRILETVPATILEIDGKIMQNPAGRQMTITEQERLQKDWSR